MSLERILWFDERVRAGSHPGSGTLAAHFNVSLRTAQRDIEFLKARLHAPLEYVPGRKGYAYADRGYYVSQAFAVDYRPGVADVGGGIAGRFGRRQGAGKIRNARIRFAAGKASWASSQTWHPLQRIQMGLDGSAVLELPETGFLEVLGVILFQRGDASVVAPRELRQAVDEELDRLAAAYGTGRPIKGGCGRRESVPRMAEGPRRGSRSRGRKVPSRSEP